MTAILRTSLLPALAAASIPAVAADQESGNGGQSSSTEPPHLAFAAEPAKH